MDKFKLKILSNLSFGDIKLVLNEVGAGTPVYNMLASRSGLASKYVLHVESNNDMEFSRSWNGINSSERMVSESTSNRLACRTLESIQTHLRGDENHVYGLSNTVQISEQINPEKDSCVSHGYFTFYKDEFYSVNYHYTLPRSLKRSEQIEMIGFIGIEILNYELNGVYPTNEFIDYSSNGLYNLLELMMKAKDKNNHNNAIVVDNGKIKRLNDIFRNDNKDIVIYKGSFNPVTTAHLNTINYVKNKYDIEDKNVYFCISLAHREDKVIDINTIIHRIELLNKIGFKVIVDTKGYFNDIYNACTYTNDYNGQKIHLPLGYDVLRKLIDDCDLYFKDCGMSLDLMFQTLFKHAIFHAFDRGNKCETNKQNIIHEKEYVESSISSTEIRQILNDENYSLLHYMYRDLYDSKLIEPIIEYLKNNKF